MEFHHIGALLVAAPMILGPTTAFATSESGELAAMKAELAATQKQLAATLDTLARVERRLDQIEAGAPAPVPASGGARLAPVNADNPALSFVIDTLVKTDTHGSGWEFDLQNAELFISAPIDPFLRGYTAISASSDASFDVEEAALITTSLPWNLTVKGGRFFANVGRFAHFHVEQLPFAYRPESIERLIPGESRAEGVELSWLAPTEHYIRVTGGIYDSIGDGGDLPPLVGSGGSRAFDELTWLVHPSTYFDLTDTLNLEVGGTFFTVPQHGARYLYGVDATLRHQPGTSEFYQGLVIGSEWLWNDEKFKNVDAMGEVIPGSQRFERNGGYAYFEAFLGRRYSLGAVFDYAQQPIDPIDRQRTYSAFATWFPSEFQRLRFQFDEIDPANGQDDQRFTLQWTAFLGSHSHGYSNR